MKAKRYTDNPAKRVLYTLDEKTIEIIRKRANELGISMSFYVRKAVQKEAENVKK